jgi:hypothetical protein
MSSATSTSAVRLKQPKDGVRLKTDAAETSEGFRPWHFFVLASLMLATVAVIMSRRSTPEHLILISFTIAAAGTAAAGFYRMLVPLTSDDQQAFRDPLSARTREALEREKTLVLRSIKELEFDRAMRKLSDRDFEEMGGRLRARAMSLMKQLDEGGSGYRILIEKELKARLAALPNGDTQPGHSKLSVPLPSAGVFCAACGTPSDPDAAFCKRCGTRLQQEAVQ